ncbi:DUF4352 domain-containing protein [Neobacillus cucumis]|uniref:DUF4352 domain-containing protein n=1 Tax=Neobacillus cucumis TaxID=1740721 RepID=UPI00203DA33D|nr:DUF4352 domain-containing protein [Neobacillus cucumis]MCM3729639.1 DUF4352 domain-containing protein [Neobacillus cucumis]
MSKLVSCKACQKEIAKGVKKCPSCGKDQRNWFMRHKILSFIGFVVVLGIIGSLGSGGSDTASTSTKSTAVEKEKQETTYKVGDVISIDDKVQVSVTKVEEKAQVGSEFVNKKASDGGTLVALQLTVKNISKKPIGSFSLPNFKLVDQEGTEYDSDIDATSSYAVETDIDNSKIMSDLNPGIQVNDVQVFEISKEAYASGKWFVQVDGDMKVEIK